MGMRLGLAGLVAFSFVSAHAAPARVEAFSPTGQVKEVRQVSARFSTDMVPLGDPRLADPFTVDCPEQGKGRWIDSRNWSYDFERDLPGGVACRFALVPGLKDTAGNPVGGDTRFSFDTGGPAVVQQVPWEGSRIDENQVFLFGLDAPASAASIAANAWCKAEGVNERIGVRVLEGAERDRILAQRKDFVDRFLHVFWKRRDGRVLHTVTGATAPQREGMPLVALQCQRQLPAGADVAVVWGAGIATPAGIATDRDQSLDYTVRRDFTATMSCERTRSDAHCIPFLPIRVSFSAPVSKKQLQGVRLAGPDGKAFPASFDEDDSRAGEVEHVTFKGPFPEKARLMLAMPASLQDDAGRALVNAGEFPLEVPTDETPPLVKFPARFGIIEANGERMLPVTVRGVEEGLAAGIARAAGGRAVDGEILRVDGGEGDDEAMLRWLRSMGERWQWTPTEQSGDDLKKSVLGPAHAGERFTLPRDEGTSQSQVIGIPLKRPGFYIVELASPRLGAALRGDDTVAYVSAAALVTNMVVHFKHGDQSSLAWVTSLDKGQPVAGASVTVRNCEGKALWSGTTDASGIARIDAAIRGDCKDDDGLFVSARLGEDTTFTLSEWNDGIEPWRFRVNTANKDQDGTFATTVFDRTLLRQGETVHMKHFLREQVAAGLVVPGAAAQRKPDSMDWRARELGIADTSARPAKAWIVHDGSEDKYEVPLKWGASAIAESSWVIPAGAKLGSYAVIIGGMQAGSLRVEQFRLPLMKGVVQGPARGLVAPREVPLDLQLTYLSGGGAALAPVKLRTVVRPRSVSFPGFEGYAFAAGTVKEGVSRNASAHWDEESEEAAEGEGGEGSLSLSAVNTRQVVLDKAGGARVLVGPLPAVTAPAGLLAEMSYQDPNGETLTVSGDTPLWPSARVIGIKPDGWIATRKSLKLAVVVLDTDGKPVANSPVTVDFLQRASYTHRRRLLGGFYAYESMYEVKRVGTACEGRTDSRGLLHCDTKPPVDGNLVVQARTADEQGRAAATHRDVWVAGSEDWWFSGSNDDRMDVLPLEKRYEPGQQATFQVRSPFREAVALVTVEREGILDTYIRKLEGREPTFSIPIKRSYAPNVFVSVLAVRGRVGGVQPTALVDLGKPAFKLGIASTRVGWSAHELKVKVATDKPVYKVRDKARVKVKVTRADGGAVPAGAEIALAAVDVALLELMPNTSWNLLESMMGERGLRVTTSTAQMQVVGKRHYGRKAIAPGGDGGSGRGTGRTLFDTLLFWKARVTLDANGEAVAEVPINDSLTAFRIVAIANGGADLFGTGDAEIRTTQDLMLMSGLPQLVRTGDRVRGSFTLRNASARDMVVKVIANLGFDGRQPFALAAQELALPAGQSREVAWNYNVPPGTRTLAWDVGATTAGAADRLKVTQSARPAVPVRMLQATLLRLDTPQSLPVAVPAGALPGQGGIEARFSSRLAGSMPGVQRFMADYSYTCFEQDLSKAVALRDPKLWAASVASLPAHLDGDGLVKYFELMDWGSDTLTAYALSVAHEAGYKWPQGLRERMEAGLANFVRGRVVRYSRLPTADLAVRKVAALEALSRSGSVAPDMLGSIEIQPDLWPTAAVIDWYLVLRRTPALPDRPALMAQAEKILRARLNMQGTTMGFSTERRDQWWWLMMSGDANANRLLLAMLGNPAWQADMGRLARGALNRQRHGHWDTTVANAWGVLAMEKFSAAFEATPVTGTTLAREGGTARSVAWNATSAASGAQASFPWPATQSGRLDISHQGTGAPWVTVQALAAVPLSAPLTTGYTVRRTVTPIDRKVEGSWSRGDVYRVRLDLEAQADQTWVVVDDPIPAGASILGTGLGRDSQIAAAGEQQRGWVWPAFQERGNEAFRAYYEFVPKGKWTVEYTVRLNNAGRFALPPTHVESMYNPEMFADLPNDAFTVEP